jgi:hypothetical protein
MGIKVIQPGDEAMIERKARWVAAQKFKRVLDVGGAEKPLRPATHVLDLVPHIHRRIDEGRGPLPELFTTDTWWMRDACVAPWPFRDNYFDYVWCCQVVEDIRDPIVVCNEMQRVGKAGFISTVHRSYESSVVQYDGVVGYHHHRWLIEAIEPTGAIFTYKSPILHANPAVRPSEAIQWLLHWEWSGEFDVKERFTGGDQGQYHELRAYLERLRHE